MKLSFSNNHSAFSIALRKKVDEYFSASGTGLTGNIRLYLKTGILLASAVVLYLLLMTNPAVWISVGLCILFGLNLAAIGFNIMHDGAHGSYAKKPWVNEIMAYTLNLMG